MFKVLRCLVGKKMVKREEKLADRRFARRETCR